MAIGPASSCIPLNIQSAFPTASLDHQLHSYKATTMSSSTYMIARRLLLVTAVSSILGHESLGQVMECNKREKVGMWLVYYFHISVHHL